MVNEQLLARLDAAELDDAVETLVLAAALGDDALDEVVGGGAVDRPEAAAEDRPEPRRIYLDGITVEGFRGVGPAQTLGLASGPGLTLVVGRNGSGKSSFAEAAEAALTGTTQRWSDKATSWRDGWRNLHHDGARRIEVRLRTDGQGERTTVTTTWAADADDVGSGTTTVRVDGSPATTLADLHLDEPGVTWRPFLSYDDLGSLLRARPSELHDRLSNLLGLEDWSAVGDRLRERKRRLTELTKRARAEADAIRDLLTDSADERAAAARAALGSQVRTWKLDALASLVDAAPPPDGELRRLDALAELSGPDVERSHALAAELRDLHDRATELRGTDAARADGLARLLRDALAHHDAHGGDACPVCEAPGALDDAWRDRARRQAEEHARQAEAVRDLDRQTRRSLDEARHLAAGAPSVVTDPPAGIETADLRGAWARWSALDWSALDPATDAGVVADHLDGTVAAVADAIPAVREAAAAERARRQDRWRPVAERLAAWLPDARTAQVSAERTKQLDAAAAWVRTESDRVRAERFAPIAQQVREVWDELRHDSNVSVDDLRLDGAATRRKLALAVTVDDAEAPGMAVLSQGELHALSLALFLPRATQDASPFRFVLIDDPVQAMDAARVDGLARVLDTVARDRQVVVFSHDERLPDACRRLGLDARVVEVSRRARSEIVLREVSSPSHRLLEDARAVSRSQRYPEAARRRVLPGLCRQAVEAVAVDLSRQRLLAAGRPFHEVEATIRAQTTTVTRLALALFGDGDRGSDVYGRLKRSYGSQAVDTVQALNRGTHGRLDTDPEHLIEATRALVGHLEGQLRTAARP